MTLLQPLVIVALAVVALAGCAQPGATPDAKLGTCHAPLVSSPEVAAIRILEQAGAASNVTGLSREAAERMFRPGYASIGPDGVVTLREAMLRDWRAAPWASRFDIKELEISVYCDMAIAIGLSEALPIGAPDGMTPGRFRWLNVWTHGDGEWRLSATQFARF